MAHSWDSASLQPRLGFQSFCASGAPVVSISILTYLSGTHSTPIKPFLAFLRAQNPLAKLVDESIDRSLLRSAMLKSSLNPVLHSIALLLAFVDTRLSIALYIILPMTFFIPSKLETEIHRKRTGL